MPKVKKDKSNEKECVILQSFLEQPVKFFVDKKEIIIGKKKEEIKLNNDLYSKLKEIKLFNNFLDKKFIVEK